MLLKYEDTLVKTFDRLLQGLELESHLCHLSFTKKKNAEQDNILLYCHQIIFIFCLKREMWSSGW